MNSKLFFTKLSGIDSRKIGLIELKGMKLSPPIWLSSCTKKGHFRAQNIFLALQFAILNPNLEVTLIDLIFDSNLHSYGPKNSFQVAIVKFLFYSISSLEKFRHV